MLSRSFTVIKLPGRGAKKKLNERESVAVNVVCGEKKLHHAIRLKSFRLIRIDLDW